MTDEAEPTKILRRRWIIALLGVAACLGVFLRATYKTWPNAVALSEKAGRTVKFLEPFQQMFFWTAVVNLVLLVLLAGSARWWVRAGPIREMERTREWPRPARWVWVCLGLLLVAFLWLRVPRLGMSLYNDEAHNYARYFSGAWKHEAMQGEEPSYRVTPWVEAVTRNMAGNNSQLFTALARASLEAWRHFTGAAGDEVSEMPVRLPSLLAGLFFVGIMGALMWRWRGTVGLLWLAVLLVSHAWLVRFQSEARSYGVMLLGVAVMFWFLNQALAAGRWRDWLGFGFGVLLTAWAFLGSVYFLVSVFLVLMGRQLVLWKRGVHSFQQVLRPVLAGLFAAMLGAQLFLGMIPPIFYQLEHFGSIRGVMGALWWGDVWSHLLFGSRWWEGDATNPVNFSMERLLMVRPWLWPAVLGGVATAAVGWWLMIKRGGAALVLAVSVPLAVVIAWAAMARKGNFLLYWYMTFAVPGVIFPLAYGLANVWDALVMRVRSAVLGRGGALAVGGYVLLPQMLCGVHWAAHPKQDERRPVEIVRGARYPHYKGTEGERPILITFWSNVSNYDPSACILTSADQLDQTIERAKREARPLFVNFSHSAMAEKEHPGVFARLRNPAEFERVATVYGQEEEQFTHHLFRWVGQP